MCSLCIQWLSIICLLEAIWSALLMQAARMAASRAKYADNPELEALQRGLSNTSRRKPEPSQLDNFKMSTGPAHWDPTEHTAHLRSAWPAPGITTCTRLHALRVTAHRSCQKSGGLCRSQQCHEGEIGSAGALMLCQDR